jgi:hypothetical protein
MREPLVVRCQCGDPDCGEWVRVSNEDADLVGCRGLLLVHPQHAHPRDRIWDLRRQYFVVERDNAAV